MHEVITCTGHAFSRETLRMQIECRSWVRRDKMASTCSDDSARRSDRKRTAKFDVATVLQMLENDSDDRGSDINLSDLDIESSDSEIGEIQQPTTSQAQALPSTTLAPHQDKRMGGLARTRPPAKRTRPAPVDTDSSDDNSDHNGGGDDGWTTIDDIPSDVAPGRPDFTAASVSVHTPDSATPVEYFDQFFNDTGSDQPSLWEHLVVETNRYQKR